jgi:hypothetical protein
MRGLKGNKSILSPSFFLRRLFLNNDRWMAIFIMTVAIIIFGVTFNYPPEAVQFPRFLLLICFALALLLFFLSPPKQKRLPNNIFSKERLLTIIFTIFYIIIFPLIGFFTATFLFLTFYMWYFQREKIWKYIFISAIYLSLIYIVFQKFLFVCFPEGLLW